MNDIKLDDLSDADLARLEQQLQDAKSNRAKSRELQCIKECLEIADGYDISVERLVRLLGESIGMAMGDVATIAPKRFQKGLQYRDPVSGDIYTTGGQGKPPVWFSNARKNGTLDSMRLK